MMTSQKKKPLHGQPRKVEPLTRKAEPAAPPHPQLEVLQERMGHLATREQIVAVRAEMHKLHGETMGRIDVLQERMDHMPTRAEMNKLHSETMERIGGVETRMGKMESDMKFIKWIGSTLGVAIIAGLVKIIFFPVV